MSPPRSITVLRTIGKYHATKQFAWNAALNEWVKVSYSAGAKFLPNEYPISSLAGLASVLEGVRRDPRALAVRGALAPWVHEETSRNLLFKIRRQKLVKAEGERPSLVEVPFYWLMIDIDWFPLFASEDLATDPEGPIDRAINELLPKPSMM